MRYLLPRTPFPALLPIFASHRVLLTIHASCAGVALVLGPFLIGGGFQERWRGAHRKAGWVYAIAVCIGGIAAIPLAIHAAFGTTAASGFFILAVSWITVTATARMAWKRRFERHRIWMLRSYALTAAAITLRLLLPASGLLGVAAGPSYRAAAWMCWLINLTAIETYLHFRPMLPSQRPTNSRYPPYALENLSPKPDSLTATACSNRLTSE
jgi:hypothetical protein